VSGAGTNTIIVDFGMDAVTGEITVYGSNLCGNGNSSEFDVTVSPIPATPVVTAVGDLLSSSAPNGNQWYFEGAIIPGATDQTYLATLSGWYWTIVTLYDCSSDASNHVDIFVTGQQELSVGTINIYPIPNDGRFTVSIGSSSKDSFTITVFTSLGVQIREVKDIHVNGRFDQVIDLSAAVNGIYTVVIRNSNDNIVKRVIINR
jgi:hypothetical protein